MTALYIILAVLFILWLIGRVRLRGVAEYSAEGLLVQVRVLWFKLTLYPLPEKKEQEPKEPKTPKKPKKPKEKRAKEEKPTDSTPLPEKLGGLWSLFRDGMPIVMEAAGKLLHKLRVDELLLHLTWAAEDPADAAMGFGAGQAALGALWPQLERVFDIRRRDVGIAVDFERTEPIIYLRASLSYTIGQLVSFGVVYGCKALALFLRHRPKRKGKQPVREKPTGK